MKLLYQCWREELPTILSLRHTHFPPFPLLVAHAHTKTNRLNFLYLVSVFNQCLRSISLSSTFPHPSPGVHGNWTLTNAYVSNFADGGGAAKRGAKGGGGGGMKEEGGRMRDGICRDWEQGPFCLQGIPLKMLRRSKCALAWQMAFSLVTYHS